MDAIVKVLSCSELIETLLTMLDPLSVKRLIQCEVVDKKVLKTSLSSKIWAGLIKRSSYGGVLVLDDVKDLVAILKFLNLEEPSGFLQPLLNQICETFPVPTVGGRGVILNRPGRPDHGHGHAGQLLVSFEGFRLLEEAESSFGTSIQSIARIRASTLGGVHSKLEEPHLSALSSRIMRQENPVASIRITEVILGGGLQSAQAFSILADQADLVAVIRLVVSEAIGEEGWRILARIGDHKPRIMDSIIVTRDGLAQGKREDIKHLFDAGCRFLIFKTLEDLQARNWQASLVFVEVDNNWSLMERVLDMSEQEFSEEIDGEV